MSRDLILGAAAGAAVAVAASKLLSWRSARRAAAVTHAPVFYYWPARGRGEHIRLVLAEAGCSWEQPSFRMGDQEGQKQYFASCQEKGGNLTTNVPSDASTRTGLSIQESLSPDSNYHELTPRVARAVLYMDGRYLTQSTAVLRYAGRKFGLYPEGDLGAAYEVDNLIAAADDLRTDNYKPMPMFGGGEPEKQAYLGALARHLDNFARLLGAREYFAAAGFSVADLTIYDTLDVAERQVPGTLAKYPTLEAFHARVEARPNIKKWLKSDMRKAQFAFPAL